MNQAEKNWKNVKDKNCEYIEIIDNFNNENKNEIIIVCDLLEALKNKANEYFVEKNKDDKEIKLNKKKIIILKKSNNIHRNSWSMRRN